MCFVASARLAGSGDINQAIILFEEALNATPENRDSERCALLYYGDAFQIRHDHFPEFTDYEDVSKALEQFQACSKLRYGPLMV